MFNSVSWLIPVLPILGAAWIGLGWLFGYNRGEAGERHTARASLWSALAALVLILGLDVQALTHGAPGQIDLGRWISSGDYTVNFGLMLDGLGLTMATLVAFVAVVTIRFSVNYMHREAGFQRFFMVLSLFTGAMLLIVTAGSAVLAFVGWELAGVSSYLLIAYAYERPTATANATRAFVTNRIGDAGFILAIALSFFWLGGVEWPTINGEASAISTLNADLIAMGFLIAALAKSAQVPFAPWIARALEGPTPSSAVFYGSLMVHAGVYLIIRLEPLFTQAPVLMVALVVLGALSAAYGLLVGLVQSDVKSVLIFSVTGQVGLMLIACGLGWFELATVHLVLHALWRAWQFLAAPSHAQMMGRPTRSAPNWMLKRRRLHVAALNRFWLDPLADWLLVRPTHALSRDVQAFDEQVVTPLVGMPSSAGALSSLTQYERHKNGYLNVEVSRGTGLAGRFMEWVADLLHWFEEHLVLKSGGEGLIGLVRHVGGHLIKIDELLSQPRYLLLVVMATLVVII